MGVKEIPVQSFLRRRRELVTVFISRRRSCPPKAHAAARHQKDSVDKALASPGANPNLESEKVKSEKRERIEEGANFENPLPVLSSSFLRFFFPSSVASFVRKRKSVERERGERKRQ